MSNNEYIHLILWILGMFAFIIFGIGKVRDVALFIFNFFKNIIHYFTSNSRIISALGEQQKTLDNIDKELHSEGKASLREIVEATRTSSLVNEVRLKHLISYWHVGIFECEVEEGKCIWVNDTLADMFGMSHHDMLGWGWLQGIEHEQRAKVAEEWRECASKDIPYETQYTIHNVKTGAQIPAKVFVFTIRDLNGKPILHLGTVEAIDDTNRTD